MVETSKAFEKGLRAGDLITEAGSAKACEHVEDLTKQIEAAREAGRKSLLLLRVRRAGDPRFVALALADG